MIDVRRGDTLTVGPFYVRLPNGTVPSLTGIEIESSVATARGATPLLTRQNTAAGGSDAEIAFTDLPTGEFYVYLSSANTLTMTANTKYYLDARWKLATGVVGTAGEAHWKAIEAYSPVPTP